MTLHEAHDVVIRIHTERYRFPDDASILWSVSRGGRAVVKGKFIDAYTDPIWPHYDVLRSQDKTVIGIVKPGDPNQVLALYDLESGDHWAGDFDDNNATGEAMFRKLKTGTNKQLWIR